MSTKYKAEVIGRDKDGNILASVRESFGDCCDEQISYIVNVWQSGSRWCYGPPEADADVIPDDHPYHAVLDDALDSWKRAIKRWEEIKVLKTRFHESELEGVMSKTASEINEESKHAQMVRNLVNVVRRSKIQLQCSCETPEESACLCYYGRGAVVVSPTKEESEELRKDVVKAAVASGLLKHHVDQVLCFVSY